MKLLLLDLYVAWSADPDLKIMFSRDNNSYKAKSRCNGLHVGKKIIGIVDILIEQEIIRQKDGFNDRISGIGFQSCLWASDGLMNVINCLPNLSQPKAKNAIHNIWQAETKDDAEKAFDLFIKTYEPKYPKAALCLQKDREELMAFFDFPAQHWQSIRTSNPIESAFATIRHRTKRSKGCLTRDGMLHMMFKLGQCTEQNWRKLRGFDYLAKVITGVTFKDGIEATNLDQIAA